MFGADACRHILHLPIRRHRTHKNDRTAESIADELLSFTMIRKVLQVRTRVRQHVNPLKQNLQVVHGSLDWTKVYADPGLPLVVDIGCGYGRFPIKYAHEIDGENVLGLEIRAPLVERAVWYVPNEK